MGSISNNNSFETKVQKIEKLLKQKEFRLAHDTVITIIPSTEEEKLILTCLLISVLSALDRYEEALDLFTSIVLNKERSWDIGTIEKLGAGIIQIVSTLRRHDRLSDAFSVIEHGEEIINAQEQNEEIIKWSTQLLHHKGIIYWRKGDFNESEICWLKCLEVQRSLGNEGGVASEFNNLGLIAYEKGELKDALNYYEKALDVFKKLNLKNKTGSCLNNIGLICYRRGELDRALEMHQKSLEIAEELDEQVDISMNLNNIGEIFQTKGELETSLEYYQKAAVIVEEIGNKRELAFLYDNIGTVLLSQAKLNESLKYHTKALVLKKDACNQCEIANTLYNLVVLTLERKENDEAVKFLTELEGISISESNNKIISQQYRLAEALVLKNGSRLKDKAQSQKIFREIVHEEVIRIDLLIFSIFNLCELLLFELRVLEGEIEILIDVKELTKRLLVLAQEQQSHSLLVKTYLIQSQIALLEFNLEQAENLLIESRRIAKEKGLWRLIVVISSEQEKLAKQKEKWDQLINRNASFIERLEISHIEELLGGMIRKRIEDISSLPQFAVELIRVSLFKMGDIGPEVVATEPLPFYKDQVSLLYKIGMFYTVSLGQGQSAHTGLFGPLPTPSVPDHVGITYSFFIKDPECSDPRWDGLAYALIVFSMPQSLVHFFNDRIKIRQILEKDLNGFSSIYDIKEESLQAIKHHVLGLKERKAD